ncbi:MAG: DNA polymerase III subunit beta [Proteobacteria bacterium]|nr:DNA polymerase III subunit beta [Pseudomonadota bacterium]
MAPAGSLKVTVERANFLRSLARLQSIVEKRNTIPILSNIKIETEEGALRLTATDMDLTATETIAGTISEEGAVTVPAHTLYEIVRKLPDGSQVNLESDAKSAQLKVTSGNAKFSLSYLPAEDFPTMPEGSLSHQFNLTAKDCAILIERTRFAMSSEETRYYLNGIYLHVANNASGEAALKAVATDGHRLARIETAMPEGAKGMPGIIIPRKTVTELSKLLQENTGDVNIALSETKIRFASGNIVLLSKLIDGTFPDYERVIPASNDKILEIDAAQLSQAIDRVSTVSTDKSRAIKLALSKGKLTLSANSPENGTAEEEVGAHFDADAMEIGFNSKYMLEMMTQLEGDTAQFLLSDPAAPVIVRDPSDAMALFVIMPMRV